VTASAQDSAARALQLGLDYYIENGYWVFTEHFLRERGYCCGSGCRHCPYRKKAEKPSDNVRKRRSSEG
jgi:hypothetical protein